MNRTAEFIVYALMLLLPLSALLARRTPLSRTLVLALVWAAIFGVALFVAGWLTSPDTTT